MLLTQLIMLNYPTCITIDSLKISRMDKTESWWDSFYVV